MGPILYKSLGLPLFLLVSAAIYAHWPHTYLPQGLRADRVVIYKSQRRMVLISGDRVLGEYTVALGRKDGRKERLGDEKTPEGRYGLNTRHDRDSHYHLSLQLTYPNDDDLSRARSLGVDPGGNISIHGIRNDLWFVGRLHRIVNWTRGCIALSNREMEDIWQVIPDNTPVDILP